MSESRSLKPDCDPGSTTSDTESFTAVRRSRRELLRSGGLAGAFAIIGSQVPQAIFATPSRGNSLALRAQDDIETNVELQLPFDPFGQPVELHPHRAPNWGPFWVLMPYVWSGLLRFDQNGAVVADLAESVEPNEDASVWTATLKADQKFASGAAVTAATAIESWKLAMNPTAPAPMATFMAPLMGFDDFVSGKSSEIGLEAVDQRTITFTLTEPTSSFPAYLATFGWAIVDPELLRTTSSAELPMADAGAGAWRFTEIVENDRLVMESNSNHRDERSPSVSRLVWRIVTGPNAQSVALDWYRNDEVGVVDVPQSLTSAVTEDEALVDQIVTIADPGSTLMIGMDFRQPPFDDVRVRHAVARSIDRAKWANEIWAGQFEPAASFTSPAVTLTSGYEPPVWPELDADAARDLLANVGDSVAAGAVDIVYYQPATDSAEDVDRHTQLLKMIEDNSGLVIRHDTNQTRDQIMSLQKDNGGRQFDLVRWWTVTDTPHLIDTACSPNEPGMSGWFNWSKDIKPVGDSDPGKAATDFTDLMASANAETDGTARNETFKQAEQLLIDNAVYIPIGYWLQRFLRKPWLQGTRQGPWSGGIPVQIDKDVVVRQR